MDKEFAKTYLQLISLDEKVSDFNTIQSYSSIDSLGPSLPHFKYPLPIVEDAESEVKKVTVTLKSIKPPKFSVSLDFPDSDTIYKVKTTLIEKESLAVEAADIKFLVKGKVVQDATVLSELDNLSFMCMIAKTKTESPVPETPKESEKHKIDYVSPEAWEKILEILIKDGNSNDAANDILLRFKSSI